MGEAVELELRFERTDPARLAQIAADYPALRPAVAAHPNAYPELIAWIAEQEAVIPESPVPAAVEVAAPIAAASEPPALEAPAAEAPATQEATPQMRPAQGDSEEPSRLTRSARAKALLSGIGIGAVIGAALSAVLLIWVLPGLFGSIIG